MRYGFAIDHRTCIGCHACTVACKAEHEIPLGQFRTWVKYVDSGIFPETHAGLRGDAVQPLHGRAVRPDLPDQRVVQARRRHRRLRLRRLHRVQGVHAGVPVRRASTSTRPTNTAAKCNFCAHRVDDGLEPACVTRVPDPLDLGRRPRRPRVRHQPADRRERHGAVRAPEQGTGPNVLLPRSVTGRARPARGTGRGRLPVVAAGRPAAADVGGTTRTSTRTRTTTLNTAHPRPWGWRVATYLWTKGVAAGALLVAALSVLLGRRLDGPLAVGAPAARDRHGDDRRPAGVGPQAAGAVPLPAHPAEHRRPGWSRAAGA